MKRFLLMLLTSIALGPAARAQSDAALIDVPCSFAAGAQRCPPAQIGGKTPAANPTGLNAVGGVAPESLTPGAGTGGDDTAALQKWADYIDTFGGTGILTRGKVYLQSAPVLWRPTVTDGYRPPYNPPSGLLFVAVKAPVVRGNNAIIRATASMPEQFEAVYNSRIGAVAPYHLLFDGLYLDGNGFAARNIMLNFVEDATVVNSRLTGATQVGIYAEGYGGHHIARNTIRAPISIQGFQGGLNDSWINENDIEGPTVAALQLDQGTQAMGDLYFERNVVTVEKGTSAGVIINAGPTSSPAVSANKTGGSLAANSYDVQVIGYETENRTYNRIFATARVRTTGSTGSISVTLPRLLGYTFDVYLDTASPPAHRGRISGVDAIRVAGGQTILLGSMDASAIASPPTYNGQAVHLHIDGNEFNAIGSAGFSDAVRVSNLGNPAGVSDLTARDNHLISGSGAANFFTITGATNFALLNNTMNGVAPYPTMSGSFASLSSVSEYRIKYNNVTNVTGRAVTLGNATWGLISENQFTAVGSSTVGNIIALFGASTNNIFNMNQFNNSGCASCSPSGIVETTSSNYNWAYDNMMSANISTPYISVGANSHFANRK